MNIILLSLLFCGHLGASKQALPDWTYYHKHHEIVKELEAIVGYNPTFMRSEYLNDVDGRPTDINLISLTDPSSPKNMFGGDKLRVVLNFGEHGREIIGPEVALRLLHLFDLTPHRAFSHKYEKPGPAVDRAQLLYILRNADIRVLPVTSVWAHKHVEAGHVCERKNQNGVDINRNWDFLWKSGGVEESLKNDQYPGPKPWSEHQSRLVRDLLRQFKPDLYINIHSGTTEMYVGWDHRPQLVPNAGDVYRLLNRINERHTHCPIGSGGAIGGYVVHGGSMDYAYATLGVKYSLTWEIYGGSADFNTDCFGYFNPSKKEEFVFTINRWTMAIITAVDFLITEVRGVEYPWQQGPVSPLVYAGQQLTPAVRAKLIGLDSPPKPIPEYWGRNGTTHALKSLKEGGVTVSQQGPLVHISLPLGRVSKRVVAIVGSHELFDVFTPEVIINYAQHWKEKWSKKLSEGGVSLLGGEPTGISTTATTTTTTTNQGLDSEGAVSTLAGSITGQIHGHGHGYAHNGHHGHTKRATLRKLRNINTITNANTNTNNDEPSSSTASESTSTGDESGEKSKRRERQDGAIHLILPMARLQNDVLFDPSNFRGCDESGHDELLEEAKKSLQTLLLTLAPDAVVHVGSRVLTRFNSTAPVNTGTESKDSSPLSVLETSSVSLSAVVQYSGTHIVEDDTSTSSSSSNSPNSPTSTDTATTPTSTTPSQQTIESMSRISNTKSAQSDGGSKHGSPHDRLAAKLQSRHFSLGDFKAGAKRETGLSLAELVLPNTMLTLETFLVSKVTQPIVSVTTPPTVAVSRWSGHFPCSFYHTNPPPSKKGPLLDQAEAKLHDLIEIFLEEDVVPNTKFAPRPKARRHREASLQASSHY